MRKPDLSKLSLSGGPGVPTMIVPPGTQISVDAQGQVSIRTPGNLVLQNSGAYAALESVSGSIRIEPNVHVEAITVRCADTCLVQGSLTAWRLVARELHVDSAGEAHVVMQETERLEVGKSGRLVGNFRSEKELFALFSRFAGQVRALPAPPMGANGAPVVVTVVSEEGQTASANGASAAPGTAVVDVSADDVHDDAVVDRPVARTDQRSAAASGTTTPTPSSAASGNGASVAAEVDAAAADPLASLPDTLCLALLLLEQEGQSASLAAGPRRALDQLVKLLRDGDLETLRHTYKTLFARLAGGGDGVPRARQAVGTYYESAAAAAL